MTQVGGITITKSFELRLPWPPSGNVQARHTKTGAHYLNPKVASYRASVAFFLKGMGLGSLAGQKPLVGPLALSFVAAPPDRRATDADNRLKCLLDALVHAGFLSDDSNRVVRSLAWDWCEPVKGGEVHLVVRELQA